MIKLNCGVSRKVGQPNFGSRGASVNVELELESAAVQDTNVLHQKIRGLFAIAQGAVDEELAACDAGNGQSGQSSPAAGNGRPNGGDSRPITDNQSRAIWAICDRLRLDQDQEANSMFQRPVAQLSLAQASQLIDALKTRDGNGR